LWHRFGPDREPIIGPGRAAGCVHPFEFQQEQEDTQERQIEPARAIVIARQGDHRRAIVRVQLERRLRQPLRLARIALD